MKVWMAGLVATAAIAATAEAAPHERSCDGKPATFHKHRAKALILRAYRDERWQDDTPAKDSEKRAWQQHRRCIRDADMRAGIEDFREREADAFRSYRAYRLVAPYPGPNGTFWAIPFYIVSCESYGGSWSASNGSHVGPYQIALALYGPPWPVVTFAQQLEHHRIASGLWVGGAGASHWACA